MKTMFGSIIKKNEYYRISSFVFDETTIAQCIDITEDSIVLRDKDKYTAEITTEDIVDKQLTFENVTIHPHKDYELDIYPDESEF